MSCVSTAAVDGRPLPDVRPRLTLGLLSVQHALIHAQSALLPLVFVEVVREFGVGVGAVGLLLGVANLLSGAIQLGYGPLSRVVSRPRILGTAGVVFGIGTSLLAAATSWPMFSGATIVGRLGASPQHTVGHALLSEQYPPTRRASAISTHIAVGNLGTVAVPLVGGWVIATAGWQPAVLLIGLPAIVVALAILASVLDRLLLGVRPYWGKELAPIHATAVRARPARLYRSMLPALRGRGAGLRLEDGYASANVQSLSVKLEGPFVVDGQCYEANGGELSLGVAGPIKFVNP